MPSNNPEYQKQYIRKHYQENKEYYKTRNTLRRKLHMPQLYRFANRYKTLCGCIDCGYKSHAVALDFDHVRGEKYKDISVMINNGVSLTTLKAEIRKCEVRCANCHRIATAKRKSNKLAHDSASFSLIS